MMIMNVFPIGFFFPKQDFVQPATKRADQPKKVREDDASTKSATAGDLHDDTFAMPLFAYRLL